MSLGEAERRRIAGHFEGLARLWGWRLRRKKGSAAL